MGFHAWKPIRETFRLLVADTTRPLSIDGQPSVIEQVATEGDPLNIHRMFARRVFIATTTPMAQHKAQEQ